MAIGTKNATNRPDRFRRVTYMSTGSAASCRLEIEFSLKPGKRREFSRSFEGLIGHEREGHIKTTVYEDWEEPGHMMWVEVWTDREALEQYLTGEEFGVLIGGLRVLSVVATCRLVDEPSVSAVSGSLPVDRVSQQWRSTPIDLAEFGGTKQ